jgi:hypothetical protein
VRQVIVAAWTRGGLLPPATIKAIVPGADRRQWNVRRPDELPNSTALFNLPKLTSDQKRDLERLISGGYVGPTESHARSAFMLTAKGVEFLGMRGAGLNEA